MRETPTRGPSPVVADLHCVAARATLCFAGDALDPDAVTHRLGIPPTSAFRRGETGHAPGSDRPAVTGVWLLGTDEAGIAPALDAHLRALLDVIEPVSDEVVRIAAEVERAEVFCLWMTDYDAGAGPVIPPRTLARIGRLDLALGFDFFEARRR
jgi:hypothetical protein